MVALPSGHRDVVVKLAPGGTRNLAQLSDDELLANTRRLVGKSNQLLAALLEHLAEVEVRGIHRTRSCASLYTYCIYELRFSEDAAARRSAAARFTKQFPALLAAVGAGELHLTGLLMIGPHLTPENLENVLGRAKFRTKRELAKLVRELNPLPDVPDSIEPLGPAPARLPMNPTWEQMVTSWSPAVRELRPGERPAEWANDGSGSRVGATACEGDADDDTALPVGPAPADLPPVTGPQHFQMQFATGEEHVRLVQRAKALLARTRPGVTLGELHLEAMKLLVAALEKRKFSVADRPWEQRGAQSSWQPLDVNPASPRSAEYSETMTHASRDSKQPRQRGDSRVEVEAAAAPSHERIEESDETGSPPGRSLPRQRYIAAGVRREVYRRDGARCTYVNARGHRCREERYLELHHLQPFAKDGVNVTSNLSLRCRAHNALAAEQDFGAEFVAKQRASARHESLAAEQRADRGRIT